MRKKFALLRNKKGNPLFEKTSGNFQFDESQHELLFETDSLRECYDQLLSCHYYRPPYPVYRPYLINFTGTKSRPNEFRIINPYYLKPDRVRSYLPFVRAG